MGILNYKMTRNQAIISVILFWSTIVAIDFAFGSQNYGETSGNLPQPLLCKNHYYPSTDDEICHYYQLSDEDCANILDSEDSVVQDIIGDYIYWSAAR